MTERTRARASAGGTAIAHSPPGRPAAFRGDGRHILLIGCLLMLFAQAVELTHSHDGLPERVASCEICLTLGSVSYPLASHYLSASPWPGHFRFDASVRSPARIHEPLPRSRGPPFA